MHTKTKQEKNKRVHACHKLMMSQKTTEGGMGIYKRRSWESKRVVQIGITEGLEQMVDSFSFITPLLQPISSHWKVKTDNINSSTWQKWYTWRTARSIMTNFLQSMQWYICNITPSTSSFQLMDLTPTSAMLRDELKNRFLWTQKWMTCLHWSGQMGVCTL